MLKRQAIFRKLSPFIRWSGTALTLALLILYFLNLPFYSGSALPLNCEWRMEHGRVKLQRSSVASRENFYIANNSEGLKFRPEARFLSASDWMINIPLWIPVLAIGGLTIRSWILHRRQLRFKTGCPYCGYDKSGNPGGNCPECGRS